MNMKINQIAGAVATSFATKMLLLAQSSAAVTTPTVQSQHTMTLNTWPTTSHTRTFAAARKPHSIFARK